MLYLTIASARCTSMPLGSSMAGTSVSRNMPKMLKCVELQPLSSLRTPARDQPPRPLFSCQSQKTHLAEAKELCSDMKLIGTGCLSTGMMVPSSVNTFRAATRNGPAGAFGVQESGFASVNLMLCHPKAPTSSPSNFQLGSEKRKEGSALVRSRFLPRRMAPMGKLNSLELSPLSMYLQSTEEIFWIDPIIFRLCWDLVKTSAAEAASVRARSSHQERKTVSRSAGPRCAV
mmetsp:Transcript_109924/g.245443  ORF Transcript_109924/g.245443 Transcript_109924/m.245443 type:complete len:231 (-) Transcript_109924:253-945(-)